MTIPEMDPWSSLRERLAQGPREEDQTYLYTSGENEGEVAIWTVSRVRADYLQMLLDERDELAAEVKRLRALEREDE